ncbi:hypothetical protein LFM09_46310 [Lentzea alba]|uniref:hypothetical protein n=1 Tax=Lentzea alba TaxID=2714351 RepID=UPI0039BF7118
MTMLVAVLSVLGALGAQWLNTMRAFRLAEIERRAKREERHQQNREDTYAKFLVAARALRPALRSGTTEAALAALRDAAAYIELNAPELAEGALTAVLDSGERWAELVLSNPATAPVIKEAEEEFHHAVRTMRDLMRNDLASE